MIGSEDGKGVRDHSQHDPGCRFRSCFGLCSFPKTKHGREIEGLL